VNIQDLLILTQNRKFTDERDPVFATLALAKTTAQHYQKYLGDWIVPNYQDTTAKVYKKLYRLITQNTASMSFPGQASQLSKTKLRPFWVPDFSERDAPSPLSNAPNKYNATKNCPFDSIERGGHIRLSPLPGGTRPIC